MPGAQASQPAAQPPWAVVISIPPAEGESRAVVARTKKKGPKNQTLLHTIIGTCIEEVNFHFVLKVKATTII